MRNFLRIFCCIFLFASSVNLQNTVEKSVDDWSGQKSEVVIVDLKSKFVNYLKESRTNEIEEKVIRLSRLMNQSIAEENRLKSNAHRSDEVLHNLNEQIAGLSKIVMIIKNQVEEANEGYDKPIKQLLIELKQTKEQFDGLKNEVDKINKLLSEIKRTNETSAKSNFFTKPKICNRSLEEYYEQEADFTWTINDMRSKMNQPDFEMLSPVFPLRGYPFGARAKLVRFYSQFDIYLSFEDVKNTGEPLIFKIIPEVTYICRNQSKNARSNLKRRQDKEFEFKLEYGTFYYRNWIVILGGNDDLVTVDKKEMPGYLVNDTIVIDIHVEPPQMAQYSCSYDGTLTWVIHDYSKKREEYKAFLGWSQLSPYFYTSAAGYRVQVQLDLYDYNWDDVYGLSAYFMVPYGQSSADGKVNFKVTLTLLHPTDPTKNVIKSENKNILEMYGNRIQIATYEEVESVLVDDTLYYNVVFN